MNPENLLTITEQFQLRGKVSAVKRFGNGLINDSFKVITEGEAPDYILQRINHSIFRDVDLLQENIEAVTGHIRRKLTCRGEEEIDRKVLSFCRTKEGGRYYFDGENYWRMMLFIPDSVSYEAVTPEYSRYAGLAFGDFQKMLADIPTELGETIPDFHNMEFRLEQLREAIDADAVGRLESVRDIVDDLLARDEQMCRAEILHREGKLPKRVSHCDTKVNNILFDKEGKILCVVDLDTVMPSYVFSDYGDFLRTAANTGAEDDPDTDNVEFDMDIFRAFTDGYLEAAGEFLTPVEIENLPYAATLFPYMQAVRFLADYINGDTYYKIQYPEHNLVRTKAQLKLLQSAESKLEEMAAFIAEKISSTRPGGNSGGLTSDKSGTRPDCDSGDKTVDKSCGQHGGGSSRDSGGLMVPKRHRKDRAMSPSGVSEGSDDSSDMDATGTIACVNWPEEYPYAPEATFSIAHNGAEILLTFKVKERYTKAEVGEPNGAVWTDSCVEFFIALDDTGYYNFEFNCIGVPLLGFRKEREVFEHAGATVMESIATTSTLPRSTFAEVEGDNRWELRVKIPVSAFFRHKVESLDGLIARGNFYKCGDGLTLPHFLSWKPIDNPTPDFHLERFFAPICFED